MKDKKITTVATLLLILTNVGLFAAVWMRFYAWYAFRSHLMEGAFGGIAVYYIIYRWLSKLYRGYSIASTSIDETVLSQFISFGISDLTMYVGTTLLYRNYVDILPGAIVVAMQLILSALIIWGAKSALLRHIRPEETLLIYGGSQSRADATRFISRLTHKYGHLFHVATVLPEQSDDAAIGAALDKSAYVIFMGVSPAVRAQWIEVCLDKKKIFYFVPEFADIVCRSCSVKNLLDTPLMRYDYS